MTCATMSGCQQVEMLRPGGARQEITLMGKQDGYGQGDTRSVIGGTLADGSLVMQWSAGDRIGVFGTSTANAPLTSTNTEPANTVDFKGTVNATETVQYAYYPYAEGATDKTAIPVSIPAEQDYADVNSVAQWDIKASCQIERQGDDTYKCQMRQMACLLRFEVNLTDVAAVITNLDTEAPAAEAETLKSISISGEENLTGTYTYDLTNLDAGLQGVDAGRELTVNLASSPVLSGTVVAYAVVAPGSQSGKELVIDLLTDKHQVQLTAKAQCDFVAGTFYQVPLNASVFSNADNQVSVAETSVPDQPEVTEETANCYMVTQAGEHSFVATQMGNGDQGIIAGAGFHVTSSHISPRSAKLLWQDTENFVSDVRLSEGRVYYQANGNVGNAVIAVYSDADCTGDILWSWHIWGVGDKVPEDVEVTNQAGAKFTMMDRTLGAWSSTSCQATLYQWGRKDPFPNASTYYVDGKAVDISASFPVYKPGAEDEAVITGSVRNCDKLMNAYALAGYNGNWLVKDNPYLWGDTNMDDRYTWGSPYDLSNPAAGSGWTGHKTIYDPCPVGYRVANQFTFTGFSVEADGDVQLKGDMEKGQIEQKVNCIVEAFQSGSVTRYRPKFQRGYFFKANPEDTEGIYFPMTGNRFGGDGSLDNVGVSADYYTSAPQQNAHQAQILRIGEYQWLDKSTSSSTAAGNNGKLDVLNCCYKWMALPVRCVRDDTND